MPVRYYKAPFQTQQPGGFGDILQNAANNWARYGKTPDELAELRARTGLYGAQTTLTGEQATGAHIKNLQDQGAIDARKAAAPIVSGYHGGDPSGLYGQLTSGALGFGVAPDEASKLALGLTAENGGTEEQISRADIAAGRGPTGSTTAYLPGTKQGIEKQSQDATYRTSTGVAGISARAQEADTAANNAAAMSRELAREADAAREADKGRQFTGDQNQQARAFDLYKMIEEGGINRLRDQDKDAATLRALGIRGQTATAVAQTNAGARTGAAQTAAEAQRDVAGAAAASREKVAGIQGQNAIANTDEAGAQARQTQDAAEAAKAGQPRVVPKGAELVSPMGDEFNKLFDGYDPPDPSQRAELEAYAAQLQAQDPQHNGPLAADQAYTGYFGAHPQTAHHGMYGFGGGYTMSPGEDAARKFGSLAPAAAQAKTDGTAPTVSPAPASNTAGNPDAANGGASAAASAMGPPPGAIDMLRKNPGMANLFDQKYGPGTAAKVLGGGA